MGALGAGFAKSPENSSRSVDASRGRCFGWLKAHWYILFFLCACAFTLLMDVVTAKTLIDGDASDFLYHAYTIARENNPFTTNHYCTTEVRPFDIAFFIAPFFKFLSNWTLVRLCGTITLQACYVASFFYLMTQARISRSAKWVSASLLLMPFSAIYARTVLYFLHYIVYITYCFLLLGLLLRLLQPAPVSKKGQPRRAILPMIFLALLWFIVGLNGVRHAMILLAPLLLQGFLLALSQLSHTTELRPWVAQNKPAQPNTMLRWFALLLYSSVFFLIGFLVNQTILLPYYGVDNMAVSYLLPPANVQRYADVLNGFLKAIGFRIATCTTFSIRSVALACALIIFGYLLWASLRSGWKAESAEHPLSRRILSGFFITTLLLSTLLFVFDYAARQYELYFVPALVMAYPILALQVDQLKNRALPCSKRILIYMTCFAFVFQGGYTGAFILHAKESPLDRWTGLGYEEVTTTEDIADCIDFMHIYGYTHGMTPYWYANTMVEQSDGTLIIAPYMYVRDPDAAKDENEDGVEKEKIVLYQWATSKTAFQRQNLPDKLVIFVPYNSYDWFRYLYPDSKLVHTGSYFTGLEVDTDLIIPAE